MGPDGDLERRRLRAGRWITGHHLYSSAFCPADTNPHSASGSGSCFQPQRTGRPVIAALVLGSALFLTPQPARADKLSVDEKLEIKRGLDAEFATLRVALPRSKKALVVYSDGKLDEKAWNKQMDENGPAGRVGDEIQITRVTIENSRILFEINGGTRAGHWYDHVQVGMGGGMSPVNTQQGRASVNGSHLALVFSGSVPSLKSAEIRDILKPVFDFEKHSAAEQYMDKLPEPIKKAIQEQRPITGMDKDQVLLALGKPRSKSRETTPEGDELEDWIYGDPPGKVTFVRFNDGKVVKINESYANVGGTTAPPLPSPR
jgi:hypothetical protein